MLVSGSVVATKRGGYIYSGRRRDHRIDGCKPYRKFAYVVTHSFFSCIYIRHFFIFYKSRCRGGQQR